MGFCDLLTGYLSGKYCSEQFLIWFETGNYEDAPEGIKENYSPAHAEALRLELPLNLLNFIRDQTESVLTASQACGQTPVKCHHPSKYDFTSPVKALEEKQAKTKARNVSDKPKKNKRVQLFSEQTTSTPKLHDEELQVKRIEESSDPKIKNLSERFSGHQKSLKLNSGNGNKSQARRSLDSVMTGNKTKSPVGLTLDDFVVKSSGKQTKKNKKGRKSEPLVKPIQVKKSPLKPCPDVDDKENDSKSQSPGGFSDQSIQVIATNDKSSTSLLGKISEEDRCVNSKPNKSFNKADLYSENAKPTHAKKLQLLPCPDIDSHENDRSNCSDKSMEESSKDRSLSSPLAKITEEDKKKFLKSEVWSSITQVLDKSPKPIESKPVPRISPIKSFSSVDETCLELIEPLLEEVTDGAQLEKLADLYSLCIELHLVPNILIELYLVLQLLTVKDSVTLQGSRKPDNLFRSVHNSVFFAGLVLEKQIDLFNHLDRVTLVYLIENPRLDSFCPSAKIELEKILVTKKARHNSQPSNLSLSVRFKSETDNRDTFPDAQTFQDFKKQRDLFYDLLRSWKSMDKPTFGQHVVKMVKLQENPVNLSHFAVLFQEQLLVMCLNDFNEEDASKEDIDLEADLKLLTEFKKKMAPSKWRNLQSRLMMPSQFGGPCPTATFYNSQEFFKDFIEHSTYAFIVHLKNLLAKTVSQMNSTVFDIEEEIPKSEVANLILGLRILAKFLAFIEALPYAKVGQNISQVIGSQILIDARPVIDLQKLLRDAISSQRLVITIPWIVEFCSILDPVTVRANYYQDLFKSLVDIYRQFLVKKELNIAKLEDDNIIEDILSPVKKVKSVEVVGQINEFNAFFLCIQLGWFFESSIFPRELLIQAPTLPTLKMAISNKTLDQSRCLKLSLLYNCCPYLSELKVILSQFHTGFKAAKVMPIHDKKSSSHILEKKALIKPEHMQDALEANFFHNQPISVKQTVEIIVERITSNFARIITTEVIPHEAELVLNDLKANLKLILVDKELGFEIVKEELLSQVLVMADKSREIVQAKASDVIQDQLRRKVDPALSSLLSDDTKENVIQLCRRIIERRINRHSRQWVRKNIAQDYFVTEYKKEFEKLWQDHVKSLESGQVPLAKQTAMVVAQIGDINQSLVLPLSQILIRLKLETAQIASKEKIHLEANSLLDFLGQIQASFAYAFLDSTADDKSILDVSVKGFEHLSFDWILVLIAFHPSVVTAQVQDALISTWGGQVKVTKPLFCLSQPPAPLVTLFSARNLALLQSSAAPNPTWDKFEAFVGRLLSAGLLLPIGLEDQCLSLLKKEWPTEMLRRLGSCLTGVMESWKRQPQSSDELSNFTQEFLEWFGWFFTNMNSQDEDYVDDLENFPELSF